MRPLKARPVVVIGAGPAGMIAALASSRCARTELIADQPPSLEMPMRVEAVPASLLTFLLELGIHPREVGVEHLHTLRRTAWEEADCTASAAPAAAHVERPALDLALWGALSACGRVRINFGQNSERVGGALCAARRGEVRLIDGTGRASVSSRGKARLRRPWIARTFVAPARGGAIDPGLAIAALPGGFVYRLGSYRNIILGVTGRGRMVSGDLAWLERHLKERTADWILEGLPALASMARSAVSPASVQWSLGGPGMRIGDAALARDILSSQGLAAGMSEALYAASVDSDADQMLFSVRQEEQRWLHLRSLAGLITRCRFREAEAWSEYAGFLEEDPTKEVKEPRIALRDGRLVRYGKPNSVREGTRT